MADTKISALTAITGANVDATADVLAIVDTSVTTTKKILISELSAALSVLGTEQASTSGTSIDFTGIPAWAKEIVIMFVGVSTNGTSNLLVQLGDSGGIETSGYLGSCLNVNNSGATTTSYTNGFGLSGAAAVNDYHGKFVLNLEDATNFTWVASGSFSYGSAGSNVLISNGSKSTSAALDRVRITTVNGTDAFDAGAINISYR